MTQQDLNSIELYESAVQDLLPILAGVRSDQLSAPTPCSEWNVQELIIHAIKVPRRFYGIVTGGPLSDINAVKEPLPPEGALAAYEAGFERLLREIKAPDALERVVVHPRFGDTAISKLMMLPFTDALIHKWDLAKATDQDTSLDCSLARARYDYLSPTIENRRKPELFGSEVEVSIDASIQDRLLAMTGRQP